MTFAFSGILFIDLYIVSQMFEHDAMHKATERAADLKTIISGVNPLRLLGCFTVIKSLDTMALNDPKRRDYFAEKTLTPQNSERHGRRLPYAVRDVDTSPMRVVRCMHCALAGIWKVE